MGWLEPLFGSDSLEHCGKNLHLQMRTSAEEFLCRSPRPDPGSNTSVWAEPRSNPKGSKPAGGAPGCRAQGSGSDYT